MTGLTLADAIAETASLDGISPVNEASLIALRNHVAMRVCEFDGTAGAIAIDNAPVEFFVLVPHRGHGYGRSLLRQLRDRGERRFWAHGNLPAARNLAQTEGLKATRTLLVLEAEASAADMPADPPPGVTIRAFDEADVDQILDINANAFATHPEQGAMDRADFESRRAEDWFDPDGLFVAERDGQILGFHWTKRIDDLGEVYVVGIDPHAAGGGLGTALTAHGLRYLRHKGATSFELYVEGDNAPALAVYRKLGFVERFRDVLYSC